MHITSFCKFVAAATLAFGLSACAATYSNHGYIPPQEDLDELVVGIDTRASVEDAVGSPSSGGILNDSGYYYVRSRIRSFGRPRRKSLNVKCLRSVLTQRAWSRTSNASGSRMAVWSP